MTLVTLETRAAAKLLRKQKRESPCDETLENYLSPAQEIEVFCTTDEREDFEMMQAVQLTADVIDDASHFAALVAFLTDNYRLRMLS